MNEINTTETPIETDLLNFYDDFEELHDNYSFLCDAFACMAQEENYADGNTAMGISRYCYWIKRRTSEMQKRLKQIHEKARV